MLRRSLPDGNSTELQASFSRPSLASLAGDKTLKRGEEYARSGKVTKLNLSATSAEAAVQGKSTYRVRIWIKDLGPAYSCTCPAAAGGSFCKHAVALALITGDPEYARQLDNVTPGVDIRSYLEGLDHEKLIELALELVSTNELALARLRLDAARTSEGSPSLTDFTELIDDAFAIDDYVPYREAYGFAQRVLEVVDALRNLLEDGYASAVIPLVEHAVERAEEALELIDDSDGHLGGIAQDLAEIHFAACSEAPVDPVQFGEHIFELELNSGDLEAFYDAGTTYASLLGDDGLAAYRRRAEAIWEAIPSQGPGAKRSYEQGRSRVTHMMLRLAQASGDVDAQVAVLAKNQSTAFDFVRIADCYRGAKRFGDALSWAERGLEIFGANSDYRLVESAAEEYHRIGMGHRAVELVWAAFTASPSPRGYERLRIQATSAGLWDAWRQKALDHLRNDVYSRIKRSPNRESGGFRQPSWSLADASDLVRVLLSEGEVMQAWTEARAAGCSRDLWLDLARRREIEHPQDAIAIFQGEVERLIGEKSNSAYAEAVALIAHINKLVKSGGDPDVFASYLASVRTRHKPKRNLLKLLDGQKW